MLHIQKTYELSNIYECIRFQLMINRFINDISLVDNDIRLLSILYVHGVNEEAINKAKDDKIFKNPQSIINALSRFRKNGYIIKVDKKEVMSDKLGIIPADSNIRLLTIKAGNRK